MFKSLKLFKLFGVEIKAHWSWLFMFLLVIDFGDPISEMLISALMVIMVFTVVLVHEFGHIFAGRKYGISTSKIILSFLGGAAIMDGSNAYGGLDDLPPKQALWVAFAGPLTNLIMFILLLPYYSMVMGDLVNVENITPWQTVYFVAVLINVVMFIFNLLPIYPMDGGRLLRSTLELFNVKKSFIISIRVTQLFCVIITALGIFIGSWTMPLIGVIFFFTSIMEVRKKRDDELYTEAYAEVEEDIKRKINWMFDSNNMSKEEKLNFLTSLELRAARDSDFRILKQIKIITDEFRENIEKT